ncbi:MAG: hypothetical protein JXA42_19265, partial [Anaerolineales bacterium]|nr:hypothetical protein [Anaerolineales bacterium]
MDQQQSDQIEISPSPFWRRISRRHPRICLWAILFIIVTILGIIWGAFFDRQAYISFSSAANLFRSNTSASSGTVNPIRSLLYILLLALLDQAGAPLPEASLAISILGWSMAALVVYELTSVALQGKSSPIISFSVTILLLVSPIVISTLGTEIPWLIVLGGAALLTLARKEWNRHTAILAAMLLISTGPSTILLMIVLLILRWRMSRRFPLRSGVVLAIVAGACMALVLWKSGSIWRLARPNPASWISSLELLLNDSELYLLFIPLIGAGLYSLTGPGKKIGNTIQTGSVALPLHWLALWGIGLLLEDALIGGAVLGTTAVVLAGFGIDWLIHYGLPHTIHQPIGSEPPKSYGPPTNRTALYLAALSIGLILLIGEGSSLYLRYMMRPTAYRQLETLAAGWLQAYSEPESVILGASRLGFLAERQFLPWNGGQQDEPEVPELTAELVRNPVDYVVSSRTIAWAQLTHSNWFRDAYQPLQEYKSARAVNSPIVIWGTMEGPYQREEKHAI